MKNQQVRKTLLSWGITLQFFTRRGFYDPHNFSLQDYHIVLEILQKHIEILQFIEIYKGKFFSF